MSLRLDPLRLAASLVAVLAFAPESARADVTKDQCVDANGKAQELRREAKLNAARQQLEICVQASCPAIVRDDCAQRLDDLDKAQPTIAFQVKDASGTDLSSVKVTVDGEPLTDKLDGTALPVDMGEHTFQFEVPGQPPVTRTLIIVEGQKSRHELIVLPALAQASPAVPTGSRQPMAAPFAAGSSWRRQEAIGVVTGAVGVAAMAAGAVLGGLAWSQWETAKSECPTRAGCSTQAVGARNEAAGLATASTSSFIAGGVLAAVGVTLYLTAARADRATVALRVANGIRLDGTF